MAKNTNRQPRRTSISLNKGQKRFLIVLGLGTMSFISFSSMLLFFFGMLPTLVAYIIDRSYQRSNTICVGGANFCGVFPYLLELWLGQHTVAGAMNILTNMYAIAIMYFAAAFGWMLFIAIPPVIASILAVLDQHRAVGLKARQKKLLEEWSKAVAEDVKNASVLNEAKAKTESAEQPAPAANTRTSEPAQSAA